MVAVVVTGPPGAGKSSVAAALHESLGDAGVHAAVIETDELARSYPPIARERVFSHVADLAASYREAGTDVLLVTDTIETDADREALLAAVAGDRHIVVRLEARPATLERRVREREPAGWSGLQGLVAASAELATSMPALAGIDLVLSTEGRAREHVAAAVEAALRRALTATSRPEGGS